MKKAAILAAALAMVLTLAACGNRDNNNSNNRPNDNNTTTDNGNVNGSHDPNGPTTGGSGTTGNGTVTGNGSTNGNGIAAGNDPITGSSGSSGSLNDGNGVTGSDNGSTSRSRVGSDLRRAADDVGDAVTGMVDGTRNAVTRGTSTTTFQRMLDNARVHDMDGVLTDGENSRW